MNTHQIIKTTPFQDQKPGTSGLRKSVKKFMTPHYLENFVQSIFNLLNCENKTIVLGGDGRYFNKIAIQRIIKMAVAQKAKRLIIGQNGLLSTPAASHLIRFYKADFGFILSASHNPGGIDGDFGIKLNLEKGQPAPESITEKIYQKSLSLTEYQIADFPDVSLINITQNVIQDTEIQIVSSTEDYANLMESLFDFELIKEKISRHPFAFDAMNAATGPYAVEIFHHRLGIPIENLLNTTPLPDFGGGHPDPQPSHVQALTDYMNHNPNIILGAASDGDGDRNLITGKKHFINPCDSLAVIAENHHLIPCLKNLTGIGRTLPTSRAADLVCATHHLNQYETPTGWKFFANLLDDDRIQLCGEESFGTSGNHIREKDGLWAVLCWLNIICRSKKTPDQLIENLWEKYGRVFYNRFDFIALEPESASKMLANFEKKLPDYIGKQFDELTLSDYRQFNYKDPTNNEISHKQGLEIQFGENARVICRLSGTDTKGVTLRLYAEYWDKNPSARELNTVKLAEIAQKLMQLDDYCQKTKADNIV